MMDKMHGKQSPSKLDHPEFLLFLVVSFMLWAIGLVDILTHTSQTPENAAIGPYSTAVFTLLLGHLTLLVGWLVLLFAPRTHLWAFKLVRNIQARWWLALITLTALGALIASLFTVRKWSEYPGLRTSFFFFAIMLGLILIFSGWAAREGSQNWRKIVAIPLILLFLVEIGAQAFAYAGMLPQGTNIADIFVPYGRVYQNIEGFANGRVNNYGWYTPDFRVTDKSERILLLGDTFVQALQVQPEEGMGARLDALLTQDDPESGLGIFTLGMPGFGPGLYLSETRMANAIEEFRPDEVVLFFHLSNDFQLTTEPSGYELYYEVLADGTVDIHEESWRYRHDLQHFIIHGYRFELDPLKTLASNYLTPKLFGWGGTRVVNASSAVVDEMDMPQMHSLVRETEFVDSQHANITKIELVRRPGASNFLFEKEPDPRTKEAYAIAEGLLRQTAQYLHEQGISFRIVTIPAFPKAFFTENVGAEWNADFGPYDLFLPEKRLAAIAADENVSFLGLGRYMQMTGASVDEIAGLYFDDGQGHFTKAGHQYIAEAVERCFYSESTDDPACVYENR